MKLIVAALALSAWLLASYFPETWIGAVAPDPLTPKLPLVSVPYSARSDVISLVPELLGSLVLSAACLLMLESAKILLGRRAAGGILFLAVLGLQLSILVDILRRCVPDWYGYGLYYLRIIPSLSYVQPRPDVLLIPAPWYSFIFLILFVVLVFKIGLERSKEA